MGRFLFPQRGEYREEEFFVSATSVSEPEDYLALLFVAKPLGEPGERKNREPFSGTPGLWG